MARTLGAAVGEEGLLLALIGPLGAGKTVFVQGLAEGLGVDPDRVTSPTFVIASHHEGERRPLVHADLYRLEHEGELLAAGWLDWLAPGAVVAVEWADRLPDALPKDHLEVRLDRSDDAGSERKIALRAEGPISRGVLARWLRDGQIPAPEETGP